MDIQAEKLDLIQWLAGINEDRIIKQFILLKKTNEEATFSPLTQEEKLAIDKGLESIKAGRSVSPEEASASTIKKYGYLFK